MFQRITLMGRVGQDPQMRYTPDGTPVTSFSVATTETISKKKFDGSERPSPTGWKESYNGKNWEITTWWRVTAWRGLGETVNQYVTKGQQIFVEGIIQGEAADGTLRPRVWTGDDGIARANFELTARNIKFLGAEEKPLPGHPSASHPQKVLRKATYRSSVYPSDDGDPWGVVRPGDERRLWFVYAHEPPTIPQRMCGTQSVRVATFTLQALHVLTLGGH